MLAASLLDQLPREPSYFPMKVLDEAGQVLDLGFQRGIPVTCRTQRGTQSLNAKLCSANLRSLGDKHLRDSLWRRLDIDHRNLPSSGA